MKKYFFILTILSTMIFAQTEYNVKSFVIDDEITNSDPFDEQLGRFQNFEIHLNKSDKVAINLKSENFAPLVILISPENEKSVFSSEDGKEINFIKEINETGNWSLFIVSGKDEVGKYLCRVSFADSVSQSFPQKLSTIEFVDFFLAQAEANLIFIKECKSDLTKSYEVGDFQIAFENIECFENSVSFEINTNLKNKFYSEIKSVVAEKYYDWKISKENKMKQADKTIKTFSLIELGRFDPRFMKIKLVESGNNILSIEFGKK